MNKEAFRELVAAYLLWIQGLLLWQPTLRWATTRGETISGDRDMVHTAHEEGRNKIKKKGWGVAIAAHVLKSQELILIPRGT